MDMNMFGGTVGSLKGGFTNNTTTKNNTISPSSAASSSASSASYCEKFELHHPFTMLVVGPSGCGKTVFTTELLLNYRRLMADDVKFTEIIWCYSEVGSIANNRLPNVTYVEGLPSEESYDGTPKLVVLDDLMHETNESVSKLFTKISHHRNVSVIQLNQNIFPRNKSSRDISLNTNYLVVFKNLRDKSQIMHLARQVCPGNTKFFMKAFDEATERPHGYLLLDFRSEADKKKQFAADIFHPHTKVWPL
jgi:hypothetical protein